MSSDNDDFDAELLALAGGDDSSSEEESTLAPPKGQPSKGSGDKSPPRRGVAQKLKSRARARKSRRDDSEDEESFGGSESDSPPPRSLARSEELDIDDDAPLYPIEGKFKSEADRSEIMAMTEIEREATLAERAMEAQRRAQDQQLKRLLQSRKDDDLDSRKRKAGNAELDDGQRKSSRQKTKSTDKMENYKRQREKMGQQRARGEGNRRERRTPSDDGQSDRDADGESEVEWDDRKRASPVRKDEPPPELRDFERIRVGRSQFAQYLFDPPFDALVKGCYCRVNCGQDSIGPKYRLGLIKGFQAGRPYAMDGPNGKKVFTTTYVNVAHGKKEKEYPFAACSDGRFTESEFQEFKATLESDGIRWPLRRQTNAKLDDVHALIGHRWTEDDIQKKMDRVRAQRKEYMDYHRSRITRRRDDALARGDDITATRCSKELAELDAGKVAGGGIKNESPVKLENQQSRLAALNKTNRKANSEEIRKALVAENIAKQKARTLAAARAKEEEDRKAAALSQISSLQVPGTDDLFGEASDISRATTPVNGKSSQSRSRGASPMNGLKEKKSYGQFSKKKLDDDVIASMDLGIDIDI